MSSVHQRFTNFLSNIEPTFLHNIDASIKYGGVCEKLHDHYYSSKYNGSTKLLIGSYSKKTTIAPIEDVDVLFIMPNAEYNRYNSYIGNGQSQLLQDIKNILLEKYPKTYIRGDGQVVVIEFVTTKIEVVPSFLLNNSNYYIPDTHVGGSWKEISPNSEMEYLNNSNKKSNGNTVRLIKMIKAWKNNCNVPIKSFVIELRSINFLKNWKYYDKPATYYDWMTRDFFKDLLIHKNGTCQIPGISELLNYGCEWESKAESAFNRAIKACDYELDNSFIYATIEWKKIFGEKFQF